VFRKTAGGARLSLPLHRTFSVNTKLEAPQTAPTPCTLHTTPTSCFSHPQIPIEPKCLSKKQKLYYNFSYQAADTSSSSRMWLSKHLPRVERVHSARLDRRFLTICTPELSSHKSCSMPAAPGITLMAGYAGWALLDKTDPMGSALLGPSWETVIL
jgi:hypothetical protein